MGLQPMAMAEMKTSEGFFIIIVIIIWDSFHTRLKSCNKARSHKKKKKKMKSILENCFRKNPEAKGVY